MKGSKIVLLTIVMVASFACSKKSTNITNVTQPLQTEVQTTEKLKVVETYSYTLEANGCSTETQTFSTLAEMCKALQNNTLNNNCALELREDFFAKNCGSSEFVAFDEEKGGDKGNNNISIEKKKLKNGDIIVDFIKTTPIGTAKNAAFVPVSCASSIADAMNLENGFTLLNGSKILIKRDQSKVLRKYPLALLECNEVANDKTSETVNESQVKIISIKAGQATVEYALLSSESDSRSELTYISCSESKEEYTSSLTHGVNLLKGSKVLVRRDVSRDLEKGIGGPEEFSLIRCE